MKKNVLPPDEFKVGSKSEIAQISHDPVSVGRKKLNSSTKAGKDPRYKNFEK